MALVDTHCHLDFPPLSEDRDGVIARARARGVTRIVHPAYDRASWNHIEHLARRPEVFPAFGWHPWVVDEKVDREELTNWCRRCGAVAIGEIGLDFKVPDADRERQIEVFRMQLAVAVELDLPVLLHNRGAFEEMLDIIGEYNGIVKGILHAYSRGPELASRFLDLGLYLAFGGALTRSNAKRAHRSARMVPPERLLLETDAPAIALEGVPAEKVEPGHVRDILSCLAELRDESEAQLEEITTRNARHLLNLE